MSHTHRLSIWKYKFVYLFLGLISLSGCKEPPPPPADEPRPVKTMVVADAESLTLTWPGKVEASEKVELSFRVSGRLVELPIKEGDEVKQGDLIARLDDRDFNTQVLAAKSQLEQAQAELAEMKAGARPEDIIKLKSAVTEAQAKFDEAKAELAREKQLIQTGATSRSSYDFAVARFESTQQALHQAEQELEIGIRGARKEEIDAQQAKINALKAQLKAAEDAFDDATLTAPYDGVIAQRFVENNQDVQAKQPIVKFQDVEEILVAIDVAERDLANLRKEDFLSREVEFAALPGGWYEIDRLKEVAAEADPSTQTYRVKLALKPPEGLRVLPGMTATVKGELDPDRILGSGIMVPIQAIFTDEEGEQYVWLVNSSNTVEKRPVEIQGPSDEMVRVTGGLNSGDRIVTAGGRTLEEGVKVRDFDRLAEEGESE